ncbi:MAG: Uma2 family endonuclease [Acidobacteria bacterium]|nr:Uma2 family endonuclease [Acidobacteriota bacterium]
MTTVVELEKVSKVAPKRFRVEDFRKMTEAGILTEESGWEIIDGYLIDKMSIGSNHAGTVKLLGEMLRDLTRNKALVSVQDPIHIDDYNEPEPDIALLKRRSDFYKKGHPLPQDVLLLIEVSNSTIEYDREIKRMLYAKAEIVEFWLVNLQDNTVEVYSQPKNGNYRLARILESGEAIEATAVENLKLQIDEILGL